MPGRSPQPGSSQSHESKVSIEDMEAVADLNILALANETCEHSGITRQDWMNMFSGLDRDDDGVLSASELRYVEDAPPTAHRNLTKRDHNLTMPQIRAGLALVATWFPEEAPRLIAHEALISALAYRGVRPPKHTQVPRDPLMGLIKRRKPPLGLVAAATQVTTRSMECVMAVVKLTGGVIALLFGLIGLETPSGSLMADMIKGNSYVLDAIIDLSKGLNGLSDPLQAAMVVKDIFVVLFEEGIFSQAIEESLSQLDWWDYTLMTVQVAATVAAWVGTGGTAFVAQIALSVFDAVDVFEGAQEIGEDCFTDEPLPNSTTPFPKSTASDASV